MSFNNLFICIFYGSIAVAQTLISRYLFKTLQFKYYSTMFLIQRLVILFINWNMKKKITINYKQMVSIVPYAIIMCTINILSSFCMTVMPLAAYIAFKKFVVLFLLILGIVMNIKTHFTRLQYICIGCIVIGGLMIGQKDILKGQMIGYISSLMYTLCQALSLQYSLYLYRQKSIGPQDLMGANSLLSIPFYAFLIIWQNQYEEVYYYFTRTIPPYFLVCFLFTIIIAFFSEYTANIISMKISPFEKASVSNIKDLILTLLSLKYFQEFAFNFISEAGIFFCLTSSIIFSISLIDSHKIQDSKFEKLPLVQDNLSFDKDHQESS